MAIKNTSNVQEFPFEQFPIKIIHKDGKDLKDTKTCYFQNEDHANKYITRSNFNSKDYEIYIKPGTNLETVGKVPRRKGTSKKQNSRSSSNN
jgi:hypothetical protein